MVLGRLFVWSAVIAGGLLILTIGFFVGEHMSKPKPDALVADTSSTANPASSDSTKPSPLANFGETYHPTEALVTKPQFQSAFQRQTVFTGELVSQHRSEVAFEVPGLVQEVTVDTGYSVEAGQVIASLDSKQLVLQREKALAQQKRNQAVLDEMKAGPRKTTLLAAQAEVEAIAAEFENLQKQLRRQQQLAKDGVIADSELDSIQSATVATAKRQLAAQRRLDELVDGTRPEQILAQQANLQSIAADIALLDLQIEKTQLKAPFDGVIVDTYVDQGAVVNAGQPVARMIDHLHLEAHIGVPTSVASEISKRPDAQYNVRIAEQDFQATFDRTLPMLDPSTQSVLIVFTIANLEFDDAKPKLIAGSPLQFRWNQEIPAEGFWVPNEALTQARRGLWSLFAFRPPSTTASTDGVSQIPSTDSADEPIIGNVEKMQVEVLYSRDHQSFVRGTIGRNDWIIVKGAHRLLDGQRVQVKRVSNQQRPSPASDDSSDSTLSTSNQKP